MVEAVLPFGMKQRTPLYRLGLLGMGIETIFLFGPRLDRGKPTGPFIESEEGSLHTHRSLSPYRILVFSPYQMFSPY